MANVADYKQSIKYETFSYLPALTAEEIRAQIQYIIAQGWNPAVEHVEPSGAARNYWFMWKLPMFGEQSVDVVLEELDACHREHPSHHIRLIGYDNYTQSQGTAFIVYRG